MQTRGTEQRDSAVRGVLSLTGGLEAVVLLYRVAGGVCLWDDRR
ncbi:hypothetical protein [Synechococcus sp. PCC 7336]|nr:hypothetical protein [Synechococcus sp. PCC 7336]